MTSIHVPFRQVGATRILAVACIAIVLAAGLFLHSRLNNDPGSELAKEEARSVMGFAFAIWDGVPGRDFTAISLAKALEGRYVPAAMLRPSGPPVRNAWGTEVDLLPYGIRQAGDSFMIRYKNLPPSACRALIAELAPSLYDIQVYRRSVMAGGRAVESDVANACQGASTTVDFIYQPEFIPGTALTRNR